MTFPNPFARIVVGLDDSPPAAAALEVALTYAEQFGGEVRCVNASTAGATGVVRVTPDAPQPDGTQFAQLDERGRGLVEVLQKRVASRPIPATLEFVAGGAAAAIVAVAERWEATAIVVGTHARGMLARALAGSVAETTVRSARVPVVVVHEHTVARPLRRVLVGIDASDPSRKASTYATALGATRSVRLAYCCAIDAASLLAPTADLPFDPTPLFAEMRLDARDALDAVVQEANAAGIYPDTEIVEVSDVATGLVRVARQRNADALVVGTHRRAPLQRFFVDSTAAAVLRASEIPTIVVPGDAPIPARTETAVAR